MNPNFNKSKPISSDEMQSKSTNKSEYFAAVASMLSPIVSMVLPFFIKEDKPKNILSVVFVALFLLFFIIFIISNYKKTKELEGKNQGLEKENKDLKLGNQELIKDTELLELFKKRGIKGIKYNLDHDYSSVINKLRSARKSLKIMAYFGEIVSDAIMAVLIDKLNNEKFEKPFEIKVLTSLNDPASTKTPENYKFIKEVQELEKDAKDSQKQVAVKNNIETLRNNIKNEINEEEKPKIEICYYNTQVRYALTIIDDEWAWWTPYHPGFLTERCISFQLANVDEKDDTLFFLCKEHFEKLWNIYKKDKKSV